MSNARLPRVLIAPPCRSPPFHIPDLSPIIYLLTYANSNRLLSISAEKFISDIVSDAYQYSRIRSNATSGRPPAAAGGGGAGASSGTGGGAAGGGGGAGGVDRSKTVLTMDDLTAALGEYGVNAKRADSYR